MPTTTVTTLRTGAIVTQPDMVEQVLMPVFPEDGNVTFLPLDTLDRGAMFARCSDWERTIQLEISDLDKGSQNCI